MTAFLALLDCVPRWLLLACFIVSALFAGVQTGRLSVLRGELADEQSATAALRVAIAEANVKAEAQAAEFSAKVIEAQNDARKREALLRAAAAGARTESDGLRHDADDLRRQLADASREAVLDRAAAVAGVLGQCAARHQVLAERCDRHVSDLRTLIDAWPRMPAPP